MRLRRDFKLLLTLIRAHALLHRATRDRDDQGRIIAAVADYAAVRVLVEKLFSDGIEATVPATVRETVAAVGACVGDGGVGEVPLTALAKKMGLDKSAVHHRVRKAIERGFLVNREEKRGMPARIATADPLPDEIEILPAPDVLGDRCSVEVPMEGIKKEDAEEEDEDSVAERPEPPDPHFNTSTPPCGGVRPPPTADVEICAQCGAADPGPLLHVLVAEGEVRLHRECRRFWLRDHPQPKGTVIPCVQIAEVAATGTLQ